MRSKAFQRLLDNTPREVEIFVDKYADLVDRIHEILTERGYNQKELADKLDKNPSEIHKWLNGDHNFTLRSIAKLEAELGETLLEVPERKQRTEFTASQGRTTFNREYQTIVRRYVRVEGWDNFKTSKEFSNVG